MNKRQKDVILQLKPLFSGIVFNKVNNFQQQ